MPLLLQTATLPEDLDAILPPMVSTFYSPPSCTPYAEALWGPVGPGAMRVARRMFEHDAAEDPTAFMVKCVDTDARPEDFRDPRLEPDGGTGGTATNGAGAPNGTNGAASGAGKGVVVGVSQWKLYPNWIDKIAAPWDLDIDYYEGEDKAEAEEALRVLPANVARSIAKFAPEGKSGEPHVRLSIVFTHPAYQRRGIGTQLVERGLRISDALGLPTWVEASLAGHEMYRRCGFLDVEPVYLKTRRWEIHLRMLRRPPPSLDGPTPVKNEPDTIVATEQEIEEGRKRPRLAEA